MKNILFLTVLILINGCHHKDEVTPETKSANLHIEFTATSSSSMSMNLNLKSHNKVIWTKLVGPTTSFSLIKDTIIPGNQTIQFVSNYSSSSITNAHIKVTYNDVLYCDENLVDGGTSVYKNVALPFIY